jgi:cobalt/nickel transport system permease protein
MHMADALISPVVGSVMWAATAGVTAYSIKKVQNELDEKKVPLMGVAGAFVFAAQMINFAVPGTGSSGHLAGGILLAMLLGPYAGFLSMASVLLIQALFFADGGILAYGCNVFNLGFYTCFVIYPFINKWLNKKGISAKTISIASMVSAIVSLQFGALSVVLQTVLSGRTELPFETFLLMMQPIHLAIGTIEGLVTGAVLIFVWKSRPEILESAVSGQALANLSLKKVLVTLTITAAVTGGILSWFASSNPDGLEWSMLKTAGTTEIEADSKVHQATSYLQNKTSVMPEYSFKENKKADSETAETSKGQEAWPGVSVAKSTSGLVGGALTLTLVIFAGLFIKFIKRKKKRIIA